MLSSFNFSKIKSNTVVYYILVILASCLLSLFLVSNSFAATVEWTGGASNNNFSDNGNWTGNAPGSGDIAKVTSTNDTIDLDSDIKVQKIVVTSSFGGKLVASSSQDITVTTTGDFIMNTSSASLDMDDDHFDIDGDFNIKDAYTVTSTSDNLDVSKNLDLSGLNNFDNGGGTITFSSTTNNFTFTTNNKNFNNITISKKDSGDRLKISGTLDVNGKLTLDKGKLDINTNNVTVNIGGDFENKSSNNTLDSSGSLIIFDESGNSTFTSNGITTNDIELNKDNSGDKLIAGDDLDVDGKITVTKGEFDFNSNQVNVKNNFKVTASNASVVESNSTLVFDGTTSPSELTSNGEAFNNLTISKTDSGDKLQPKDNLDIDGDFSVDKGTLDFNTNDPTTTITGNLDIDSSNTTWTKGAGTTTFDGSSTSKVSAQGQNLGKVAIDGSSKTVKLNTSSIDMTSTTIGGDDIFDLNGHNVSTTDFTNNNVFNLEGGESVTTTNFDTDSGTTTYYGGSDYSSNDLAAGNTYNNLRFNGSGTWSASTTDVTVNGGFTVDQGAFEDGGQIVTVKGDWDNNNTTTLTGTTTFKGGSSELDTGAGGGEQEQEGISADKDFENLKVSLNSNKTLTTAGATKVNKKLLVESGTFQVDNKISVSPPPASKGEVLLNGGELNIDNFSFNNLNASIKLNNNSVFDGSNSSYILIGGSLSILDSSTFNSAATTEIKESWNHPSSGGTFNHQNGEISFIGNSSVSVTSSDKFYDVSIGKSKDTNSVKLKNDFKLDNNLTFIRGKLDSNSNNIDIANSWIVKGGNFDETDATVNFLDSGSDSEIKNNLDSDIVFNNLKVNVGQNNILDASAGFGNPIKVNGETNIKSGTFIPKNGSSFFGDINIKDDSTFKLKDFGDISIKSDFDNDGTFNSNNGFVTFDGPSVKEVNVGNDAFDNIDIIQTEVEPATNTLDINGDLNLIANGELDPAANDKKIEVAGNWSTLDGTFIEGDEKVVFDGFDKTVSEGGKFHKLEINQSVSSEFILESSLKTKDNLTIKSGSLNPNGNNVTVGNKFSVTGGKFDGDAESVDLDVNGNASITGGTLNLPDKVFSVEGDLDIDNPAGFDEGSGTTTIDISGDSSVTNTEKFNNFKINTGNTVTLESNVTTTGDLTITSGDTLDVKSSENNGIELQEDWTNNGTFNEQNGTVKFVGSNNQTINNQETFYELIVNNSGSSIINSASKITTEATTTIKQGKLKPANDSHFDGKVFVNNSSELKPDKDIIFSEGLDIGSSANFVQNSGTTTFDSSNDVEINPVGGQNYKFNNIVFDGSGSWSLKFDHLSVNGDMKFANGTFDAGTRKIYLKGDWNNTGGVVKLGTDNTTTFAGNSASITSGGTSNSQDFGPIVINTDQANDTITLDDNIDIDGKMKINTGVLDTNSKKIYTSKDVIISDTNTSVNNSSGSWVFDGSDSELDAGGDNIGDITVDGSTKTLSLVSNKAEVTTATIKGDDTLDINGQNFTVNNDIVNENIVKLQGDENVTISGSYDNDSGTTTYSGSQVDTTIPGDLTTANNVKFDHSATWTLFSDMDLEGDLIINNGTLDVDDTSDHKITLTGDWDSSGGTFKYRDGLVEFDGGDQAILGSEFNELKKVVSSTNTFELPASETTTVAETTTLKGTNGATLKLRSTQDGTDANFAIDKFKQELHNVDVKDIDASVSNTIYCVDNCTDSGNVSSKNFVFSVDITFNKASDSGNEIDNKKFEVSLSEPYFTEPITVDFLDNGLQATPQEDYTFADGSLTIAQGDKSAYTSKLLTLDDKKEEGDEKLEINLDQISSPSTSYYSNLNLGSTSTLTYTILANDEQDDSGGGGGGSIIIRQGAPKEVQQSLGVEINKGSNQTNDRNVTVNISGKSIDQIALSNSPNFANNSFQNYKKQVNWKLESGNGKKTVYVKIRTDRDTFTRSDSIKLIGQNNSDQTGNQNQSKLAENCPLPLQQPYTTPGDKTVKYNDRNCETRAFESEEAYFSYFDSWNAVKEVSKQKLNQIPESDLGFMPWGPKKNLKAGTLFKTVSSPKVFLLQGDGKKCWIKSESVFNALYFEMSNVIDVNPGMLSNYKTCSSAVDSQQKHPPYIVIKGKNSDDVYRLEPSPTNTNQLVKRKIVDMTAFEALGYKRNAIVEVPQQMIAQYQDGKLLGGSESNAKVATNKTQSNQTDNNTVKVNYTFSHYMKRSSRGTEVTKLQKALKKMDYYQEKANGYYDLETVEAVQSFQKDHDLTPVGVVGPSTRTKLNQM
jgi:hypothetical protein